MDANSISKMTISNKDYYANFRQNRSNLSISITFLTKGQDTLKPDYFDPQKKIRTKKWMRFLEISTLENPHYIKFHRNRTTFDFLVIFAGDSTPKILT